ncbi:MAG: type IV toxin-antitoxin system AbiEi family antitoxin domain-containing protein, partial [Promethearchaeota archaeon]
YSIVDVEHPEISPDPFIFASKLRKSYYLGYATALELNGAASIMYSRIILAVKKENRFSSFVFPMNNPRYEVVSTVTDNLTDGVKSANYQGQELNVSSLARTFIDVVNQPHLVGGWAEAVRSLDNLVAHFHLVDLEEVVFLLEVFENTSLTAKVGYLLELYAQAKSLTQSMEVLESTRSRVINSSPTYLTNRSSLESTTRNKKWNIYVPMDFTDRYFTGQRIWGG